MLAILRDLLRYNAEFRIGAAARRHRRRAGGAVLRLALSAARHLSSSPPDVPPSWAYPFGTTSRGQDVFWQLTVAIRNTLAFGIAVALLSRVLSLAIGLFSGYKGGWIDRVLMSINDTFIVIPLFPILVLFYFVMRDRMSWAMLALIMACLGWAYDARLIRSVAMSLKTREFTQTSIFSGMTTREILMREHLPYVMPIVFSTTMNNMNWSIGLEVTLSVLGFTDINTPTIGGMIYWANQHTAMVAGVWWWIAFPVAVVVMAVRRPVPACRVDERVHRSAQPAAAHGRGRRMSARRSGAPIRSGRRGADPGCPGALGRGPQGLLSDALFRRDPGGAGGRRGDASRSGRARSTGSPASSSSGKTTLIKTIAGAMRPPLEVVGGTVDVQLPARLARACTGRARRAGRHPLAPPLLHHAGLHERAEPGAPGQALVRRLRLPAHGLARPAFWAEVEAHLARVDLDAVGARRLSARAVRRHAPARHDRARDPLPARVRHRRRADDGARRAGAEDRARHDPQRPARDRLVAPVRHPRHGRARRR